MNNFRENTIKYGSYALVFLAPLVFWSQRLYPHISSKTFFIYGVVEIIFFLWLYSIIVDKSYRLHKTILMWFVPLMGFVLWMTVAGIFGVNFGLSFWSSFGRGAGLLTLYHSLAFSFVVASLVNKNGLSYVVSLFQSFVAGAFFLATSIWMGTEGFKFSARVFATDAGGGFAGNSTLAAGYLLFALAMGVFLLTLKNLSNSKKWFIGITIASIIFSPVFVNIYGFFAGKSILGLARGTALALLVGIGVVGLVYMFLSNKRWVKGISIASITMGLIGFIFLWMQLVTPNTFLNQKFAEEARGTRFIFWDIASEAMGKHPVMGYGPENYFKAYQENFNAQILLEENASEGWVDRAHNIYYDLGVAGGYPAIILYALFVVSMLYGLYMLHGNGKLTRIQASVLAGLLIAHISNHLFTFESNLSMLALFTLAGIIYALGQNDLKQTRMPVSISETKKGIAIFAIAALFIISWVFLVYMPSTKSKAYAETFSAGINKRSEIYPELLKGSPVGSHWDIGGLSFEIYKLFASNAAQLKSDKEKIPYVIKDLEALISHLYKVSETNKTDYRLYITTSFLENTLTYFSDRPYNDETRDRVLGVLEKAQSLAPKNPNVYWSIAQVKVWSGDFAGAEKAYRDAIAVAPHLPASYNLLLKYAEVLKDQKLFNETMIQAKENIPGYELK